MLSHEENNEKLGDSNQMTTGVNCTGVFFLQFRKMWEKSKKLSKNRKIFLKMLFLNL